MSTKWIKMWQGGIKMASLNVTDVIKELDISKSYLYKLIDKENILIPRNEKGRYFWDENTVETIKSFLHIDISISSRLVNAFIMMDSLDRKSVV